MKKPAHAGSLNRRVVLCSAKGEVFNGQLGFYYTPIRSTFARIEPIGRGTNFRPGGFTTEDTAATHLATMRYMADLDLTTMAWLHEVRRISLDQWYRILTVEESPDGRWWHINCVLEERTDRDKAPAPSGLARTSNVVL